MGGIAYNNNCTLFYFIFTHLLALGPIEMLLVNDEPKEYAFSHMDSNHQVTLKPALSSHKATTPLPVPWTFRPPTAAAKVSHTRCL